MKRERKRQGIARARGHETHMHTHNRSQGVHEIKYLEDTQELSILLDNHGRPEWVIHQPCPKNLFQALEQADSLGEFYNRYIRNRIPHVGTE